MDLIDRQAVLDTLKKICAMCGNGEKYNGVMCGACYLEDGISIVEDAPSVQPEIIRCRDCRWKQGAECVRFAEVRPFPDDFCSRAERRTNGKTISK